MRVTVGISFFNNETTLADAIRSVFAQTFRDWELLLVDDGSTDGSLAIAQSTDDPRVRVISDGENRGVPYRLNQITEMAEGEFIARMDGDDMMSPDRLAEQVAYLDANPNVDIVSNGIYIIDGEDNLIGVRGLGELDASPASVIKRGVLIQGSAMGRTEWWRKFPYDASYRRAEENELWCRSCKDSTFGKIRKPLYFCREQAKSPKAYLRDYLQSARTLRRIYRKYGHSLIGSMQTLALIGQTHVKSAIYCFATCVGLQSRLINRRNRSLADGERAKAQTAMQVALRTQVSGLPAHAPLPPLSTFHSPPLRLCRVVTVPSTFVSLLRHQLRTIARNGIDVTIVSGSGEHLETVSHELSLPYRAVEMKREISLIDDIRSLIRLYRLFKSENYNIAHSSTAKAGLLVALAAWLAHVPIRIHTYTGQRWVELRGFRRWITRFSDRIIGKLTTHCYADSKTQAEFLVKEGIVEASKITVLASGSISGVDLKRFDADAWRGRVAAETRRELGVDEDEILVLFVGRINRDKGVIELVSAFRDLAISGKKVELALVGPFEPELDPLPKAILDELDDNPRIRVVGRTPRPERYMGAADVLCLPSYREGFGSVVVEAAAMGVPTVATSIVGLTDAVEDGKTGILVPSKDVESLRDALQAMIIDTELREEMGQAARERARRLFDAEIVNQVVAEEYWRLSGVELRRAA